jgi:phosphate transport system protein
MRARFENKLTKLRDQILRMGSKVQKELEMAMQALADLDSDLAQRAIALDQEINDLRFSIEERCVELIATQQPAASDLRFIVATLNIIVDLERMGDQSKNIAKIAKQLCVLGKKQKLDEIWQMGKLGMDMLDQCLLAFAQESVELAQVIEKRDDEMDDLYDSVITQLVENMTAATKQKKVEVAYETLRIAENLERIGDLVTNFAERVVYIATGDIQETNV